MIALFTVGGILTSVLTFLGYKSFRTVDPVLVFLVVAYPFLIGTTVHYYLRNKSVEARLREEYFIKWYLQSLARVCLSETSIDIVREELASSLMRLVRPAVVNIFERDPQTQRVEMVFRGGMKNLPPAAGNGYALGEGIPGWVMQNQKPVIVTDISSEFYLQTDSWAKSLQLRSYTAVPLIARGEAVGLIGLYSFEPGFFQDSNVLIVQLAAQLYGLHLAGQKAA